MDLAHRKLKAGGVLALIVSASAIAGTGWKNTRRLLAKYYEDIAVTTLTSADSSTARAFSNDTNMAEAVIVATKRDKPCDPDEGRARYICLLRRPATNPDGVDIARIATPGGEFDSPGGSHAGFAVPGLFTELGAGHPSGVVSAELCSIAGNLVEGRLRLPNLARRTHIPMVPLRELGYRGPVDRDINEDGGRGPYIVTPPTDKWRRNTPLATKTLERQEHSSSSSPVLWSHDATLETCLIVLPCSRAVVREDMQERASQIWNGHINKNNEQIAGATRLHINIYFQVNSQPLGACLTPGLALGGQAWPSFAPDPPEPSDHDLWEKALCVWLNSTLGLVGRWWISSRQQNGRARLSITSFGGIPALDLRKINPSRVSAAAEIFDEFVGREFRPANEAYEDPVRQALDDALATRVLHLPKDALGGIARLRDLWCREPSVHGNKSTRPPGS